MAKKDPHNPFAALGALKDELAKQEAAKSAGKGAKAQLPVTTPAKKPGPRPTSTPEEEELSFHRMISGVTPLDAPAARVPKTGAADEASRRLPRENPAVRAAREADEVHEHLRQLVEGPTRFEVIDDGRRVEGRRLELGTEVVRKLRRGLVPVDSRVDLHGLGADDARATVERFLREQRARGERCVLVIHGKGDHSRQLPVLRGEIAAWLSQGKAAEHVAAFATATPDDGGEGAVYVLLRR